MTGVLGREALEAIAIVAVTTAALATGRREERSSLVHGRRGRMPTGLGLVAALAALALGAAAVVVGLFGPHHGTSPAKAAVFAAGLPGELTGRAPWPANTARLRARLGVLGLPALSREGTAMHLHQHLDVFVHGRRVPVPAGIGIDAADGLSLPLHTHDASGIVHVESPDVRTYTLGQLFGVWGVRLTRRCLGGYCDRGDERVRVYVDGRRFEGDPAALPLAAHDEIVVAFGTPAELPRPLPARYVFPAGL